MTWSETVATRQLLEELGRRVSQLELAVSLRRSPPELVVGDGG